MAYITKKTTVNGVKPIGSNLYGTCSSASDAVQKDVVMADFDVLVSGVTIHVEFTHKNTASNPTLKVGSTSAVAISCNGTAEGMWEDGAVISFTYNGTNWIQNDTSGVGGGGISILDCYPVGSYYETSDASFDPNSAWGGTWVLETEGQVHIGAGSNYTIGDTGGEETHTLDVSEMPSHTHAFYYYHASGNKPFGYNYQNKGYQSDEATSSGGIVNTGGGGAHNNMQPYIVVNRWHRTA